MTVFQVALFMLAGVAAYRSTVLGLVVLLVTSCSFDTFAQITTMQLPTGSIAMQDFVILAILLKTIKSTPPSWSDNAYAICLLMIAWISVAAALALLADQIGLREFYRAVFRLAVYWILPISVRGLAEGQKTRVVAGATFIAVIVSIVQMLVLASGDPSWMALVYPVPVDYYGALTSENFWEMSTSAGVAPRFYPPGTLLVQMILAFSLGSLVFREGAHRSRSLWFALLSSLAFTLSLVGRSNLLGVIVAFSTVLIFGWFSRSFVDKRQMVHQTLALRVCAVMLVVGVVAASGGTDMFDPLWNRASETLETGEWGVSTRMDDNIEAWSAFLSSPIWGIGSTKVHWEALYETYGGQDVHPVLSQGLLAGIPGLFLLLLWFAILVRRLPSVVQANIAELPNARALAAAVALVVALFLTAINTTPVFLFASSQVPFGLFCGLVLAKVARNRQPRDRA